MTARGKIESCIACHLGYEDTDYVTREYLKESEQCDKQEIAKP
ncbi:MAG: hypothetical protein AAGG44_03380 [Planctomycetota bacterium]